MQLFPDAKLPEDVAKDFVGGDLAGDGAEVVEGFAEILGDQVGRGAGEDAGAGEGEGAGGCGKGVEMPGVGDQSGGSGVGNSRLLALGQALFQGKDVPRGLRGHWNNIYLIISERNNIVKFCNNFVKR